MFELTVPNLYTDPIGPTGVHAKPPIDCRLTRQICVPFREKLHSENHECNNSTNKLKIELEILRCRSSRARDALT